MLTLDQDDRLLVIGVLVTRGPSAVSLLSAFENEALTKEEAARLEAVLVDEIRRKGVDQGLPNTYGIRLNAVLGKLLLQG